MAPPAKVGKQVPGILLPDREGNISLRINDREVALTNLQKIFWPGEGITKGRLLQYYLDVSPFLLPHLLHRAMVMKRYPNGAFGTFFFMKRAPRPRPSWIETCKIKHTSGNVIEFPVVQNLESLLWIINLGCIDLNQWYATCDDVNRPDYIHFDLDPVPGADFADVRAAAATLFDALSGLGMKPLAKTSGSRGVHVYIPIVRGPSQKEVWSIAKTIANTLAAESPEIFTAEYRKEKRPRGRVLIDYNQNAWGRTLAAVYSVRPRPGAPVSMPVTLEEIRRGVEIEDFSIFNAQARLNRRGDLWAPLLRKTGRMDLAKLS